MSPRAETLRRVTELWEILLGHASFGPDDPFFDVGGDSRRGVELTLILAEEFECSVTTADVFQHPTPRSLAGFLDTLLGLSAPAGRERGGTGPAAATRQAPPVTAPGPADPGIPLRAADVAVIGMAGRFPGAADVAAFWELLVDGGDPVGALPDDRRALYARYYDLHPSAPRVENVHGGFLAGLADFDAPFFQLSFRDANTLDPAHRIMLEVAWEALEDAGYADAKRRPDATAVFVGATAGEYARLNPRGPVVNGHEPSLLANRISYLLNARGPSIVVDTACSSSLVALHQACQSLASGESELALVGGVNLLLTPERYFTLGTKGVLSATGRCRPFDDSADGFVPAEGAVMIVLKPLRQAVADGDTVLAVIRGTAVNHNGRTNGINSPDPAAQAELMLAAWDRAEVAPEEFSYIEAHGTGTKLGDPIEIQGLKLAFERRGAPAAPATRCAIGSVKSSIGHLEWAAGLAGLVKCVMAVEQRLLPGTLHFERPNSHIAFENTPFEVLAANRAWPGGTRPRVFGVSSFGLGGVNAHAVLMEPPSGLQSRPEPAGPHLMLLSARTPGALRRMAGELLRRLSARPDWTAARVCQTLAVGRATFAVRAAAVVASEQELLAELRRIASSAG